MLTGLSQLAKIVEKSLKGYDKEIPLVRAILRDAGTILDCLSCFAAIITTYAAIIFQMYNICCLYCPLCNDLYNHNLRSLLSDLLLTMYTNATANSIFLLHVR